jgi:hypothetical protein
MKTLSKFFSENKESKIDDSIIMEDLSFKSDPPNIIMLKRKAIRVFPDGRKVALYYADKIHQYVTIPYHDMMHGNKGIVQVHEAKQDNRGNMPALEDIVQTGQPGMLSFDNGGKQKVDVMTAQAILNVYNKVNLTNRVKIMRMINKDQNNFAKVAAFAHGAHTDGM